MSVLLTLHPDGHVTTAGAGTPRADGPVTPPNAGQNDTRRKIVPIVKPPAAPGATSWEGGGLVDLASWLSGTVPPGAGLLLQPGDPVEALSGRLEGLALIAIDIHRINDGRAYSLAFVLRQRLGWTGPLRAVGAVTADQAFALHQLGFDQLLLRADQHPDAAISALETYALVYRDGIAADDSQRAAAAETAREVRLERALRHIATSFRHPALASGQTAEDQVITDMILRLRLPVHVVARAFVQPGLTAACDAWITGLRRAQAGPGAGIAERDTDPVHHVPRFNPLADWSAADVAAYARRHRFWQAPAGSGPGEVSPAVSDAHVAGHAAEAVPA
jgi:uncharacterized protein (DUF934 family)